MQSIPYPEEIGREEAFSEEQIIGFLREAEAGVAIKDLCRRHGFSEASYYLWRSKFGSMSVPDAKWLKDLEAENTRLKKLLAEQVFQNDLIRMRCKTMVSAPARRALVREWIDGGASERCALAAIGMSASALRYRPREDRNVELRERILRWRIAIAAMAWDDLSQAAAGRASREL